MKNTGPLEDGEEVEMEEKKLALVGCGFLGGIVADAYAAGLLEGYRLTGALSRTAEKTRAVAEKTGCRACASLEELLALEPDCVVETASVQMAREMALPVLRRGADLVLVSVGALADADFRAQVEAAARESGAKVRIASGAVGGFDVLRTVSLMARAQGLPETAGIVTHKGPQSLKNTPVFREALLTDTEESCVLSGTAAEAIAQLPTKVNVAVAASLATTGPDSAGAQIFSVPGFVGDDHCITAEIDGVRATVDIYSRTSAIAGWSVVALLRNLVSPIVF